jgi:hypothetical protein
MPISHSSSHVQGSRISSASPLSYLLSRWFIATISRICSSVKRFSVSFVIFHILSSRRSMTSALWLLQPHSSCHLSYYSLHSMAPIYHTPLYQLLFFPHYPNSHYPLPFGSMSPSYHSYFTLLLALWLTLLYANFLSTSLLYVTLTPCAINPLLSIGYTNPFVYSNIAGLLYSRSVNSLCFVEFTLDCRVIASARVCSSLALE